MSLVPVAEQIASHQAWLDGQPMTARCAVDGCGWTFAGTVATARAAAAAHRAELHPDLKVRSRRVRPLCSSCHVRHAKTGQATCGACDGRAEDRAARDAATAALPPSTPPAAPPAGETAAPAAPPPVSAPARGQRVSGLTPERFAHARRLYHGPEAPSIRELADRFYAEWGYANAKSLSVTLSSRGITIPPSPIEEAA